MIKVSDIYKAVDEIAPFSSALDFDNVGVLAGDCEAAVTKVIIALDITKRVVSEAKDKGAELIISHHPIIFDPLKSLKRDTALWRMAEYGISALCCHTNLDLTEKWGTNIAFGEKLGLQNIEKTGDCIFSGELIEAMDCVDFANFLDNTVARPIYNPVKGNIKNVAFCTGSGGDFITEVIGKCDAYITGEAHHDEMIFAVENNIPMFVLGHYETEKPYAAKLKTYLDSCFPETEFILSEYESNPVRR